jgi:general transcription factor 3C polypeptide 1
MNEHLSSSIISYLSSGSVMQLIRLVRDGYSEDGVKAPHARSRHAMELKPYVEEPLSIVAVSNLRCLDLRPRIRHDFFLLNREAVDEYWKTLEYCYAAAHQIAAKHAFPGSVVPEVCAWCFVCQVFLA